MLPLRPNPTDSNFVLTELRNLIEMQRDGTEAVNFNRGKLWLTLNVIREKTSTYLRLVVNMTSQASAPG